ncbi:MAG: trypsin-like serine protease, partial [Myxococcales bacterium]|nr:trypsin-like serine protease [Myxococcales bacterium]
MIPRPPSPCPGPARLAGAVATLLLAGLAACDAAPTAVPAVPAPSLAAGAIVNGETETGWVGVGALTTVRGTRYGGAYCTAELVAPQWVLTAGHCVAGEDLSDQGITPASTRFFIGADARGGGGGSEPDGDFYQADAFVPHPGYDPRGNSSSHDIGLVHLATPVAGEVPIYGLMEGNLQTYAAANGPLDVFTVGYGATEGIRSSGSGLKRSTHVALSSFGPGYYTSLFDGTGTCFGDSGGPGFITLEGGVPVIIGVTSAGAGCLPGDSDCDPCQTETYVTRVDSHLAWIQ